MYPIFRAFLKVKTEKKEMAMMVFTKVMTVEIRQRIHNSILRIKTCCNDPCMSSERDGCWGTEGKH